MSATHPLPEPDLLPVQEVARRLGVSEQEVRNLIAAGVFPTVRIGRRVNIPLSDYQAVLRETLRTRRLGPEPPDRYPPAISIKYPA